MTVSAASGPALSSSPEASLQIATGTTSPHTTVGGVTSKQTVIIFDWDDTLMSSSWIDRAKLLQTDSFSALPVHLQQQFSTLEEHVGQCLSRASTLGSVVVITNAEDGWIEYSSKRFFPRLVPVLKTLRIVSARSQYEKFYPGAPLCWKAAAFAHEANQLFGGADGQPSDGIAREIISFGDSNEERTAVKIAAGQLGAVAKSIKFVDLPTPDQLCKQVETITGWLTWVVGHATELDLMLKATGSKDDSPAAHHNAAENSASSPWRPPTMSTLNSMA